MYMQFLHISLVFIIYVVVLCISSFKLGDIFSKKILNDSCKSDVAKFNRGLVCYALIGYLVFWLYVFLGKFLIYPTRFILLLLLVYSLREFTVLKRMKFVGIILKAGLFYLSILYLGNIFSDENFLIQRHFFPMPGDNYLPWSAAGILRSSGQLSPFHAGWTISDRPPIQTGLTLLFCPNQVPVYYTAFAILLQLSWLPSLFDFLNEAKIFAKQKYIITFICMFSGFFMFNSLYTWPKLLSMSFAFLALAEIIRSQKKEDYILITFSGLCFACALLSHTGIGLSFFIFVILILFYKTQHSNYFFRFCLFLVMPVILYLTWKCFAIIDPPGDHLIKMHLAGVNDLSDRRSFLQSLIDIYRKTSIQEIVAIRINNLKIIVASFGDYFSLNPTKEFFYPLVALGPSLLGLFYFPFIINKITNSRMLFKYLSIGVVCSFIFWICVFVSSTVNHQNSYLNMSLLFVFAGIGLSYFKSYLMFVVLCLHILKFLFTWILSVSEINYFILLQVLVLFYFLNRDLILYSEK
jgi:hypothetical protein